MTEADRPAVDRIRARLAQQPSWIIEAMDVMADPNVKEMFKARAALDLGIETPSFWVRGYVTQESYQRGLESAAKVLREKEALLEEPATCTHHDGDTE